MPSEIPVFLAYGDNKNRSQKQPGEKPEAKYHYNPGNQSGKTIETTKPEPKHAFSPFLVHALFRACARTRRGRARTHTHTGIRAAY
jgi:hypothetical protein